MAATTFIWIDSFDHYDVTSSTKLAAKGYTVTQAGAGSGTGRYGNGLYMRMGNNVNFQRTLGASYSTLYLGIAYRTTSAASNATHIQFREGSTVHLDFRLDSSNRVVITRNGTTLATASAGLTANLWYYLQIKVVIHDSTGEYEVLVNGSSATLGVSGTGADTRNGGTGIIDNVVIMNNAGINVDIDDLWIYDGGYVGEVNIQTIYPTGAGNSAQFTPSTGSNWQNVDETNPNDDSDYNSSSTAGHTDTFVTGDVPATSGSILAVVANGYARKDDAGTRTVKMVARRSSTDYPGAGQDITGAYAYYREQWATDPSTSGDWSRTNVNAAEFGYELDA